MSIKAILIIVFTVTFLIVQTIHAESLCDKSLHDPNCEIFEKRYSELLSKSDCEAYPEADKITIYWENEFSEYFKDRVTGWYKDIEYKIVRICNPDKEDICVLEYAFFNRVNHQSTGEDQLGNFYIIHDGRIVNLRESISYRNYHVYFPACQKGDILVYTLRRDFAFPKVNSKGDNIWSDYYYYFQDEDPILNRTLKVTIPMTTDLKYVAEGVGEPEIEKKSKIEYTWTRTDIEPYNYEAYSPPKRDTIPRVSFSSIYAWEDVDKWMCGLIDKSNDDMLAGDEDFVLNFGHVEYFKDVKDDILSEKEGGESNAAVLYEWVRDNVKYATGEFWTHSFEPYPNRQILETLIGDCKDHATLLTTLLRAEGVDAHPVLIRADGDVNPDMPHPTDFDHEIVVIDNDGEYIWLDPTCEQCEFGYIPPSDQGKHVLILFGENEELTITPEMSPEENGLSEYEDIVTINTDNSARFEETITYHGWEASQMRYTFSNADSNELEDTIQQFIKRRCYSGFLEDYKFINLNDKDKPTIVKINYTCFNYTSDIEDYKLFELITWVIDSAAIAKESRTYPLEFDYTWVTDQQFEISLPPGYEILELPDGYSSSSDFADCDIEYSMNGDKILVTQDLKLKKKRIEPEDYPEFKKFFEDIMLSCDDIKLKKVSTGKSKSLKTLTGTTGETKGICGPSAIILLTMLPLVGVGLLRRNN